MMPRNVRIPCAAWLAALSMISASPAWGATEQILADSAAAMGTHPHTLYLKTGDVNLTLTASLLANESQLAADAHFVIHLDGPITPQRRAALGQAGVRLGQYLPMYSYICTAPGVKPVDLAKLGFVHWLGEFNPAWRISPDIGTQQFTSQERKELAAGGRVQVWIELLPDMSADGLIARLGAMQALVLAIHPGESTVIGAEVPLNSVADLKDVPEILFVEEMDEPKPRDASVNWISQSNVLDSMTIWNAGITGTGQIAGIIDWSLVPTHCCFNDGVNPIGPSHRKIRSYYPTVPGVPGSNASHGAVVSSILAGEAPGQGDPNFRGMAYNAKFVFQDINQSIIGGSGSADLLRNRLTIAHNDGARMHSNSWGGGFTTYTNWARDIDLFSRLFEDDVVFQAPPNSGNCTNPENAKNCLGVCAAGDTPTQDIVCSGALGPTADGRRKPDLTAAGCGVSAADFTSGCSLLAAGGATSWACPAAAGLGVLTRQYFIDGYYPTGTLVPTNTITPTGALIRAMLVNTSVDMTGQPDFPNTREGWGRILLNDAVYLAGDARKLFFRDKRNSVGIATDETDSVTVRVVGGAQSIKITLVWTDVAAAFNAAYAPINNLDLVVTAPDASIYKGNVFVGGVSATGGLADDRNNVEQVLVNTPLTGDYTIQIVGTAVNSELQGYALVVTGDIIPFECGATIKGDVNLDGLVDGRDIQPFAHVITTFTNVIVSSQGCAADIGGGEDTCSPDGLVDASDLPGFVTRLLTGSCP